ncbi:MAG: hypothetical protein KDD11_23840 [Acidobacteria bacterium]|nr:hypothetical protein [Acidobacteriota bacterium]
MVRTVAEFEKDELREALRKAGEKAVCEERSRKRGERKTDRGVPAPAIDEQEPTTDPDEIGTEELLVSSDPDDLKCERVQ